MITVLAAFIGCIGFAIQFNVHGPGIIICALGGALAWLAYCITLNCTNDTVMSNFIAAIFASVYAEIMARLHKVPVTVYLIAALIPLVPGSGIYYTMEHFIDGNIDAFLSTFVHTIAIAGCLAFGILLVSSLVRLTNRIKLDKNKRKVAR